MSEQNKHHHRKSKSDKSASRGSEDSYPGKSSTQSSGKGAQRTGSEPGIKNQQSGEEQRGDRRSEDMQASQPRSQSSAPNEDDSKLHFADATLQTPEEHATDEKTDPSLNDKTTATP